MRKLLRSIARHNMNRAGAVQINKKSKVGSKFARYWRQYVYSFKPFAGLKRKGVKAQRT